MASTIFKNKAGDETNDEMVTSEGSDMLRIPGYDVLKDPVGTRQRIEKALEVRRGG